MSSFAPLRKGRRAVTCRMIILFRAPEEAVADLLPPETRPYLVRGAAVGTVCFTRLGTLRSRWLPTHPGTPSDHLAVRIAVRSAGEHTSWVLRRDTSSWFEARCGETLMRGDYRRARFQVNEDLDSITLRVSTGDTEELFLRGTVNVGGWPGRSVFSSTHEVETFLRTTRRARPGNALAPEADRVGEEDGSHALEPLDVAQIRATCLEDICPGAFGFDSAFWLVPTRRAAERARAVRREPRSHESTNNAPLPAT